MRQLLHLVLLVATPTIAQIVITPNVPQYNFQVLAGSTRQINVQVGRISGTKSVTPCGPSTTPSCVGRVNWTVSSTEGGASVTFTDPMHAGASSISGALATIQVNIGPKAGICSISGGLKHYSVTSTATVTVQAQSVDDTSKTASFLFNVCTVSYPRGRLANGTSAVIITPAYRQAYANQNVSLQSWVVGQTNQNVAWSVAGQPAGGNGTLADTTYRDTVFHASVPGRYTLAATSAANGSLVGTSIIYISPDLVPSYSPIGPEGNMVTPCDVDPAFTGADYEVGAGKTYTTINSAPAINTWTPGTIMRIWNTDMTGMSPSTFHEYYQVSRMGTATQPIIICGVPDSLGNLPIIDGSNASGNSGISPYAAGFAVMNVEVPGVGGYWNQVPGSGATAVRYVSFTGLHIRNANPNYTYTPPGGGAPVAYGSGAACFRASTGQYIDLAGNDLETCGFGLFTDNNTDNGWWKASQNISVVGNHFHNNGWTGNPGVHQLYFQTFYAFMEGNRIDHMFSGGQGCDIKWRGIGGIFRYNYLDGYNDSSPSTPLIQLDLTDNQDGQAYETFEGYIGGGYPAAGDTAGPNIIAAYQEAMQQDYVYGNIFVSALDQTVHYNGDEDSGMADRNGVLYFYNNTIGGSAQTFRTNNNAGGDSYYNQRIDARNNIVWPVGPPVLESNSTFQFGSTQSIILSGTTNLFQTGSISIAPGITGGVYTGPSGPNGWYAGPCNNAPCPWPLTLPFDSHLYNLTSANYLMTPSQPFDSSSYVPAAGSAAIGAGAPLTGYPATLPVRWNFNTATNSLTPRLDPRTIGAEDQSSAPWAQTQNRNDSSGRRGGRGGSRYVASAAVSMALLLLVASGYWYSTKNG